MGEGTRRNKKDLTRNLGGSETSYDETRVRKVRRTVIGKVSTKSKSGYDY